VTVLLRFRTLLLLWFCLTLHSVSAQVDYTANDSIIPYQGHFRAGSNLGEYIGLSDEQLGDLAAGNEALGVKGVGVRALRPALYEDFVENFGYDSRVSTYEHYASIGLKDNTVIIGFPSEEHRDPTQHCPGIESTLFRDMYTDIWDDGENGTPINDDNYYAAYVYKLVTLYKDHVKFWEIWNEPGFDYTMNTGWLRPGDPGNWWDNNPDPCDYKLRAPIYHYVRLLRISYEVIKSVDPEAYVAVSGVGFPSFLDAILRNTDNPVGGFVSEDYPLGGGAYFDVMGFHFYPHFDGSLQEWNQDRLDWDYYRHSDAAADGMVVQKDTLQYVLEQYGYDGQTFPNKEWIITECNLPRKAFDQFIGSDEAQRNFMIKAIVQAMKNEVLQLHIYKLGEDTEFEQAGFEFDLMGFYKKLNSKDLYFNELTDGAIAHHTASDILNEKIFDPIRTAALGLPDNIEGGAFKDEGGNYTYVLWARTGQDQSEEASATFSFPLSLNVSELLVRQWDYSESHFREMKNAANITLTGAPIFLSEMMFTADAMSGCAPFIVNFDDHGTTAAASWNWTFEGGMPASSTDADPRVTFNELGKYKVTLEIKDANGNIIASQADEIVVNESPAVNFSTTISGPVVRFDNLSSTNTEGFIWDFGDGNTTTEPNPDHLYLESGSYTVKLTGTNSCQATSNEQTIDVVAPSTSRIDYTANDSIKPYDGHFRPGVNLKFYPPWSDEQLGDIAAGNIETNIDGAGVKAIRTLLPEYFLTGWTYDIRQTTFNHYVNLDLADNTVVLGFPSAESIDKIEHCPGGQSQMFEDMYLDIWDDGTDGSPINEDNTFADYIYNTVLTYKDYVQFWQILNSPGFDVSTEKGWLPRGEQGNWWENDPEPCDLVLKAPIQHYIRMLRISYEIIKNLDPDSYVTVSGLGFPSFLDALLRNTDNPIDGSVTTGYPLKGGAYFDAIGFNVYPFVDGSTSYYDVNVGGVVYQRHSDAAVGSIPNNKTKFQSVLDDYGYDGATFPNKHWVISECNIPRRSFNGYIGSDEAQRNFIIKAYVASVENEICQLGIEALAENALADEAKNENEVMGLYQKIADINVGEQELTDEGVAFKTTSELLFGTTYDVDQTASMNLPQGVRGAAFQNVNGNYIYVLWAETSVDQSEEASASYSFPASFGESLPTGQAGLIKREWNYSQTEEEESINIANIVLTGTPIFLLESGELMTTPLALFQTNAQKACAPFTVDFTEQAIDAENYQWYFPGATPASSTDKNPSVTYEQPGVYSMTLEVSNAAGTHRYTRLEHITADSIPEADFDFEQDGPWVQFTNRSINALSTTWRFGDGNMASNFDPRHFFFQNGNFTVMLVAGNECGLDTIRQVIEISNGPAADFVAEVPEGCGPYNVQFRDGSSSSPTTWTWSFPGAEPNSSTFPNPMITYPKAGIYNVELIVNNDFGADTVRQEVYINADAIDKIEEDLCSSEMRTINGITYNQQNPIDTQIIANGTYDGCDSLLIVNFNFLETSFTEVTDTIDNGDTYMVGTNSYSMTGMYTDTLQNIIGCDSIVQLNLTVLTTNVSNPLRSKWEFKAYPNPFNQELTISFTLPEEGRGTLELYDVLGRKAKTIIADVNLPSGQHQFRVSTDMLPEGIYHCRLVIDNQVLSASVVHVDHR